MKVREKLPKRRENPTKVPKKGKWSQHKPDLREDFHCHCGYCGSYDGYRHTWYEVDHFIPKSLFEPLGQISTEEYSNLVYSCKFCNNNKLSKWPSGDVNIPNYKNEGFIDPCNSDYDNHLYRMNNGSIMWKTELGKWMWNTAFKFDERNYAIKLLWEVNQLRKLIFAYSEQLSKMDEQSNDYRALEEKAKDLSFKYVLIHKDLMDYYNSL
ncbi:HNH endonuclease signature motif containing protein [Aureisphaera galaxeae]|uniref:HNH endonuclease n=1 Tax=Aureisphaera galaxeae TaxID=1538023 RepID=UPI002350D252|nr:HNH endonuclease signature motif containing protein [Aureisphaera galaxeae]MDC8004248.1 HNH endonuclease signature motif containing protein [Aureisphaera galaxeae]